MFNVKFCENGEGDVWFEHVKVMRGMLENIILETEGGEIKLPRNKYQYLYRDDEAGNDDESDMDLDWRGYGEEPEDIPEED